MKNEKVVFLDASRKTSTYPQRSLPVLLEQIRDYSSNELNQLFIAMLDDADDVFFDSADKACSNSDQSLFFNSMREIRIIRKRMEATFSQELKNNFLKLQAVKKLIEDNNIEQLPIDALSLVQEDELEENLALNSMVAKADAVHKSSLHQIVTRLDTLLANLRIDKSNNPLSPKLICESFRRSSQPLELDIKARLVVFKLFDRLVVAKFGQLYEGVNNFLVDKSQLVQALSTIQEDTQKQEIAVETPISMPNLRGQLASALPISGPVSSRNIGQSNDDIIDIVSLLFDFILDQEVA